MNQNLNYAAAGLIDLICDWNFIGAERNLQKSIELNPHYALVGDEKNARKTDALLVVESRRHFVSPLHLAALYTALDESDTACSHLENALAMRDPWLLWIAADPRFDNLRAEPRFQKIEKLVMSKSAQSDFALANTK